MDVNMGVNMDVNMIRWCWRLEVTLHRGCRTLTHKSAPPGLFGSGASKISLGVAFGSLGFDIDVLF